MSLDITTPLFNDICQLIDSTRNQASRQVNSLLVLLHWQIGQRVHLAILKEERAEYGEKIIQHLANQLTMAYGRGFGSRALFRMVRFAKLYPDKQIVTTLSTLLSLSHFMELILLEDPLKRQFYTEMCRLGHWSVRELRKKIGGMLYERTTISRKPEELIEQDLKLLQERNELSQDLVFRDPYVLDFLQLSPSFSEMDLENAILDELCSFLQELGSDFCFITRQKRITIDDEDYYLDLRCEPWRAEGEGE